MSKTRNVDAQVDSVDGQALIGTSDWDLLVEPRGRTPPRWRLEAAGPVSAGPMIRLLIADNQAVVRGGLTMIMEAQPDIEVAGVAGDGREAVELVGTLDPDVVLMDIRMPIVDGIEATRRIVADAARSRVLVLTAYGLDENVYAALKAGAAGFMVKTDSPEQHVQAVPVVASGESLLGPEVTRRLIERFLAGPAPNVTRRRRVRDAHRRRGRGPEAGGCRPVQHGDRGRSVCERGHRQNPRRPDAVETGPARPSPSGRVRDECALVQPGDAFSTTAGSLTSRGAFGHAKCFWSRRSAADRRGGRGADRYRRGGSSVAQCQIELDVDQIGTTDRRGVEVA